MLKCLEGRLMVMPWMFEHVLLGTGVQRTCCRMAGGSRSRSRILVAIATMLAGFNARMQ